MDKMEYCYDNLNKSCVKVSRFVGMKTALYLVILLIVLTTIFGNLLVIIFISHFKQLHSPHHLLVMSLATADLLLGLCVLPFSMIRTVETCWYLGSFFCRLHTCIDLFFCTVSIFHLGFIAIDRYFAVCDPLHYSNKISIGVVCCFIAIAWMMSAFYSFGLIFSKANDEGLENVVPMLTCEGGCIIQLNKLWSLLDALTFVIPCFGMICIYAQVFNVARKQARQIQIRDFKIFSLEESKQRAKRKREQKAAKTLGIVMGVFLACWSPIFNDTVVNAYNNYQTPTTVFDGLIWLAYSNSTFNPLIYGFFYPWFRKALKLIITFQIFQSHSSLIQLYKE